MTPKDGLRRGARHANVVAQWSDPGEPVLDGGAYRIRGFARSTALREP